MKKIAKLCLIKNVKFVPLLIFLMSCLSHAEKEKFSVGAGVGALYANAVGLNASYRFANQLDLIGAYNTRNRGTIGLQYHFTENQDFFQSRLTAFYGINGHINVYNETHSNSEREYFNGVSIGGGSRLAFGRKRKHGVNVDIMYRTYDGGLSDRETTLRKENRVDEPNFGDIGPGGGFAAFFGYYNLELSVGWNYKF
jgi:hypothetical protein